MKKATALSDSEFESVLNYLDGTLTSFERLSESVAGFLQDGAFIRARQILEHFPQLVTPAMIEKLQSRIRELQQRDALSKDEQIQLFSQLFINQHVFQLHPSAVSKQSFSFTNFFSRALHGAPATRHLSPGLLDYCLIDSPEQLATNFFATALHFCKQCRGNPDKINYRSVLQYDFLRSLQTLGLLGFGLNFEDRVQEYRRRFETSTAKVYRKVSQLSRRLFRVSSASHFIFRDRNELELEEAQLECGKLAREMLREMLDSEVATTADANQLPLNFATSRVLKTLGVPRVEWPKYLTATVPGYVAFRKACIAQLVASQSDLQVFFQPDTCAQPSRLNRRF